MGTDKALVGVGGEPMAARVAGVLLAAGASIVVLVGASGETAAAAGLASIPDDDPGSGPLGGLATALAWAAATARAGGSAGPPLVGPPTRTSGAVVAEPPVEVGPSPILLLAACDQPALRPERVRELAALVRDARRGSRGSGAARFITGDGRRHPFPSAWRVDLAAGPVARLHAAGERRIGAAFDVVATSDLPGAGDDLVDLDSPADLVRWQERSGGLPAREPRRP